MTRASRRANQHELIKVVLIIMIALIFVSPIYGVALDLSIATFSGMLASSTIYIFTGVAAWAIFYLAFEYVTQPLVEKQSVPLFLLITPFNFLLVGLFGNGTLSIGVGLIRLIIESWPT